MGSELTSLIERLEKADGPDRDLDCRIAYALGMNWCNPKWSHSLHDWRQHVETHGFEATWTSDHVYRSGYDSPPPEDFKGSLVPNWTASLDAALALVEQKRPADKDALDIILQAIADLVGNRSYRAKQPLQDQLARATTLALLRSLSQEESNG